ncbi:MAG: FkbM family methyltransferase [Oligoflexales bacterium]
MNLNQAYGLSRSLAVYYGRPWKAFKMLKLYSQFLSEGDLAFDVGSHVGNRALIWSVLGVKVVAVEPQALFASFLNLLFTGNKKVTVLKMGLDEVCGNQNILVSDKTPTVSSLKTNWCEEVREDARFEKIDWNRNEEIVVKRLEDLIEEYGEPKFCKIDVEGNEYSVLKGLDTALKSLSFEYLPILNDATIKCVERIEKLAAYEYNWSETESMNFKSRNWLNADDMIQQILQIKPMARSGDIYARKMALT